MTEYGHFLYTDGPLPDRVRYSSDHVFRTVENHEPFEDAVFDHLINEVRDRRPVGLLQIRIKVLAALCQLQHFLGNGFLPDRSLLPRKPNPYYDNLERSWIPIVDSCRRRMDPKGELLPEQNVNVFDFLVRELRNRLGPEGLDFVRRCMSWDPEERRVFLRDPPSKDKVFMFRAALKDPFLSRFNKHREPHVR